MKHGIEDYSNDPRTIGRELLAEYKRAQERYICRTAEATRAYGQVGDSDMQTLIWAMYCGILPQNTQDALAGCDPHARVQPYAYYLAVTVARSLVTYRC